MFNVALTLADCLTATELQPKNRLRTRNLPVDRQAEKVHTSRGPSNHLHTVGNVLVCVGNTTSDRARCGSSRNKMTKRSVDRLVRAANTGRSQSGPALSAREGAL